MKAEQIERLEALLALPGFPFGGPMFASDLCEFDEDGDPVPGSWDLESREIIAACVNFMCANGPALLQLARADWRAQFVEVSAMRYMDNGLKHDFAYAAAEQDACVIEKFGTRPTPEAKERT